MNQVEKYMRQELKMENKYRTGLQRFNERFPNYFGCTWKYIAEDSRPTTEGRLRDCLDCDGKNLECDSYTVTR